MTFHLCCRLIPACRQFAPMYRREAKEEGSSRAPDNVHSSPRFHLFRGTERFRFLRNQHGSTPRQLCGIGFSSAACAGESVSSSIRLLHPIRVKRLITAIAVTIAFSPSIPFYSRPLRTLPRIAFTLDFCAFDASLRSFDARVGHAARSSGFCSVVKSLITATSRASAASRFSSLRYSCALMTITPSLLIK